MHFFKIFRTLIIFSLFCLNAKAIHTEFVTKKKNALFEHENDKNNGVFRDDPQTF